MQTHLAKLQAGLRQKLNEINELQILIKQEEDRLKAEALKSRLVAGNFFLGNITPCIYMTTGDGAAVVVKGASVIKAGQSHHDIRSYNITQIDVDITY